MFTMTINQQQVTAREGETILEVAKRNHIQIPTLCHLEGIHQIGACRICVVEVEGAKSLMASCVTPATSGMVVRTHTPKVRKARKVLYELMLSDHPTDCLHCARSHDCEFRQLGEVLQVDVSRFAGQRSKNLVDTSSASVVRDNNKCILCRRCVSVCNEIQGVGALNAQNRGFGTSISPGGDLLLGQAVCAACGQCTLVCPVNALKEKDATKMVWDALADPELTVVVQTAPAVRAALGEPFGMPPGSLVTGKMAAALRRMGFDAVFDTNFTADLPILEEGYELLGRLAAGALANGSVTREQLDTLDLPGHLPQPVLPMITSCSPGWIKYSCKSPHMMLGALTKTWYAQKQGIDPKRLFVVSVMPCTAKKYEVTRPEMATDGIANVDAVLTTRELAQMIREAGIDFIHLPDELFDSPMGLSTGAADIFGVTGGVMEAALRTVYAVVTGQNLPDLNITTVRGLAGVKEASVEVGPLGKVKIAVTHGLGNARRLLDLIRAGKSDYAFIEIMCCPGGCIAGGGEPIPTTDEIRTLRAEALYRDDGTVQKKRQSHENESVQNLYRKFLHEPLGHKSHELLHTHYVRRGENVPHK